MLMEAIHMRDELLEDWPQVWGPDEFRDDFQVIGFAAPLAVVRRKKDGLRGTVLFQHNPRFYFGFMVEGADND
jgi:hypothetical protein|tara:strand:- start:193 stop:411 length:219 start_codon:yes stop_codon:yes gene_type:complete